MVVVIITGTPATGKSTLARLLDGKFGYSLIDTNKLVKKLSEGFDKKRHCVIVDSKRLNKELISTIKRHKGQNLVIDSHLSHYLSPKYVDLCIVTKCSLKQLKKRLEERYKDKDKVRENLDAEIFDICHNEAKDLGHKVVVVDTTKGINIAKVKKLITLGK